MKKKIEITIPVYNEEKELEKNILRLHEYCAEHMNLYDWHITIADNASNDQTEEIAKKLEKEHKNISLLHLNRKGRGRAVKEAWRKSKAEYCSYMDLDLSTDLIHLPELIHSLEKGYDISIGSRLAKGARVEGRTLLREITSRTLNFFFIQIWFRTHFTDAQCGFKAVTREVVADLLPHIEDEGWFFDGELLIIGEKSGYKIYEIPVHWVDNPGSTVRLISTITGDLKVMTRLLFKRPWEKIKSD